MWLYTCVWESVFNKNYKDGKRLWGRLRGSRKFREVSEADDAPRGDSNCISNCHTGEINSLKVISYTGEINLFKVISITGEINLFKVISNTGEIKLWKVISYTGEIQHWKVIGIMHMWVFKKS